MDDFRTVALPYCLKKMEDGTYIILNRRYKPIGFNSQEHVIYEDYPIHHKIKGINKKQPRVFLGTIAIIQILSFYIMMGVCPRIAQKI